MRVLVALHEFFNKEWPWVLIMYLVLLLTMLQ